MMGIDYKKYSLENLEKWIHDAMSSGGASPQEIYDVIVNVVKENYYTYKNKTSQAYELLALLNSGIDNNKYQDYLNKIFTCDNGDSSKECKSSWNSFWKENYYPEEYSQYTEEELNSMCDKAASDEEKEKCREYNLREAEYYDKRAKLDATYDEMIAAGYEMTDDGFWIPPQEESKGKKWTLPVELDGLSGECYVILPDDLLEAANLKEGDMVEWIDNGDGSCTMKKLIEVIKMEEC
jgi:hypothetical protein